MAWVLIAQKSHVSVLRNCGQTSKVAGYGKGPVEQPRPPEMEDRENPRADDGEERHAFREAVHRRAQIVTPQDQDRREQARAVGDADPPGIVDEVEAPDEGNVHAPDADAQDRDRDQRIAEQQHQRARRQEREPPDPAEAAGERDFRDRARDGLGLAAHRLSVLAGLFDAGEIGCARLRVQGAEERIVARALLEPAHRAVGIVHVAEDDGFRRAGLLARRHHLAVAQWPILDARIGPGRADPLDAIGAFFHDATIPTVTCGFMRSGGAVKSVP